MLSEYILGKNNVVLAYSPLPSQHIKDFKVNSEYMKIIIPAQLVKRKILLEILSKTYVKGYIE